MCMGGKLLANIAELFCKNNSHYRGGLPDLTLWNVNSFNCKVSCHGNAQKEHSTQLNHIPVLQFHTQLFTNIVIE